MPKIRISFTQLVDEILVMPKSKEKTVYVSQLSSTTLEKRNRLKNIYH